MCRAVRHCDGRYEHDCRSKCQREQDQTSHKALPWSRDAARVYAPERSEPSARNVPDQAPITGRPPQDTAQARAALGPDAMVLSAQAVVLATDATSVAGWDASTSRAT